jgi:hypothetical protein
VERGAHIMFNAATPASAESGSYLDEGRLAQPRSQVQDQALREALHETGLHLIEN